MVHDAVQLPSAPRAKVGAQFVVASRLPADVETWGAIHAQPRAEKVVAAYLEKKGVPHYLPMTCKRRAYGPRVRHSWIPLFPGYLFYDAGTTDKRVVYGSRKVARILLADDPAPLRTDLANLAGLLQKEPELRSTQILEPGARVEVVSGPYLGTQGEFIRRRGEALLVVRVHFIGYGAELAIDESYVRPLDPDED